MTRLAIIGGTALTSLPGFVTDRKQEQQTPWGSASGPLVFGSYAGTEIVFLARHGNPHTIPPHKVNYRANIWALKETGVVDVISINAVGGITKEMCPGRLVIPDQIIDYTWSRQHTFHDNSNTEIAYIDFTQPYCERLRRLLIAAGAACDGINLCTTATYGVTQGPRLESAAEIRRMEHDGCDIVGMTAMPETALARELGINLASCALVVNWAAGKSGEIITMQLIEDNLRQGARKVSDLLARAIPDIVA